MKRGTSALSLVVGVTLAAASAVAPTAHAFSAPRTSGPTSASATTALPLYEFTNSGSGLLTWRATALAALDNATTMIAGPRTAVSSLDDIIAFTTNAHTLGYLDVSSTGTTFTNLASVVTLPPTANAPTPFFDARGRLNFAYVDTAGHVILVTHDPDAATSVMSRAEQFDAQDWLVRDLSTAASTPSNPGGLSATGQVAVVAESANDLVAVRTTNDALVVLTVSLQRPFDVSAQTILSPAATVGSDPVALGAPIQGDAAFATTTFAGHVLFARQATGGAWTTTDLTSTIATPTVAGDLAGAATGSGIYVAGATTSSGAIVLDTYSVSANKWVVVNVTAKTAALVTPGPSLAGGLAVTLVGTTVSIAGAAAGWGDLFDYEDNGAGGAWTVADVSATGGSAAKTIGDQVAAVDPAGTVTFFAGGVDTPAPPGVGIYDIPTGDLSHAVSDGWPILADTGGLGTSGSPWVNVPAATSAAALSAAIKLSPDFEVGAAIAASHKRETWLSFWTVSGPGAGQLASPGAYRNNAFAAGEAVATTIDQYAANGLGLKPDWVILDPEGYPDNHSQLDGYDVSSISGTGATTTVTTSSTTTLVSGDTISLVDTGIGALNVANAPITVLAPNKFSFPCAFHGTTSSGLVVQSALYVANWTAIMTGWREGLDAVDPSLNAAIYTEESQYSSAHVANSAMPVFMAIAWGTGGGAPVPITHSSNVLGFIEFGNDCVRGEVQTQLAMLTNAPWSGRYNTVQFNPPGYCTPTTP